jgi:hypothetical protein
VDLEPVMGVYVASELSRRELAHVALVLPRWPYLHAVLPVETLISALIDESRRLKPLAHSGNVVFFLDGERALVLPDRPASDRHADNRYRLSARDLPNLATLQRAGIRRVLKVARA